nr:hypothetical protein Iba_chr14aCG18570 [Ipomoea batatas]
MPATNRFLIMSSLCLGAIHITKLVTRNFITQNVTYAETLSRPMHQVLLNTVHTLFGPRNTAHSMSVMEPLAAVAVSEWSHGKQNMLP